MSELLPFLHLQRSPFEYIPKRGERADFSGEKRLVNGYLRKLQIPIGLIDKYGKKTNYPAGTGYLQLHFEVPPVDIRNGQLKEVGRILYRGFSDLTDLAQALKQREALKKVQLIVGATNTRLAHLAVKKLGFHHYTPPSILEKFEISDLQKRLYDEKGGGIIFTTPKELIQNIKDLRASKISRHIRDRFF